MFLDPSIHTYLNFVTDPQRLKQVLINLLRNSVKFTTRGVIKISGAVEHCSESGKKILVLKVYDTGIGIKEADLSTLFQIFGKLPD